MAALTPTQVEHGAVLNRRGVFAKFASVADGDTWTVPLHTVEGVFPGLKTNSDTTVGATVAGRVVTFRAKTGGLAATAQAVDVLAVGYD